MLRSQYGFGDIACNVDARSILKPPPLAVHIALKKDIASFRFNDKIKRAKIITGAFQIPLKRISNRHRQLEGLEAQGRRGHAPIRLRGGLALAVDPEGANAIARRLNSKLKRFFDLYLKEVRRSAQAGGVGLRKRLAINRQGQHRLGVNTQRRDARGQPSATPHTRHTSTTRPPSTFTTRSARSTRAGRWATTMRVMVMAAMVSAISASVAASRFAVPSSSTRMDGRR